MKYLVIQPIPIVDKQCNRTIFEHLSFQLKHLLSFQIINNGNIVLNLRANPEVVDTIEDAQSRCDENAIHFILEHHELNDNYVAAIHDSFFTQRSKEKLYRIDLSNLYIKQEVFDAKKHPDSFFDAITYMILKELCMHNPLEKSVFFRGLSMLDFLYSQLSDPLNSVTENIIINKKEMPPLADAKLSETQSFIPQINIDEFNLKQIRYALENVGTFELIGPSITALKKTAENALTRCKEILDLPKAVLYLTPNKDFNGFQNVRKETKEKVRKNGKGQVRNQIAFHCKPYLNPTAPGNLDLAPYIEYYDQGLALLHTLYRYIAISYKIAPNDLIDYLNDQKSVLTTRKYSPSKQGETGIPAHSDYGLLTLVVSDEKGLEVEVNGDWLEAPHSPGLRFFVNFGDWFGFQLRNLGVTCKMGIHRVPEVEKVRHSLALFLNPDKNQTVTVPNGEKITYETYLSSPTKLPYINSI